MRQTLIVMSRHIEFDLKNEVFRQYENLTQNFYKKNRTGDLMNRIRRCFKSKTVCWPAVMYSINTIRFTIVIVYMYNVSPLLTLYTILPLPLLSCIFKLSSEINKRSTVFSIFIESIDFLTGNIFRYPVIKAYSLEDQHQNNMVSLAKESKSKV
jgi:ATP-binding cassette subfamily B protein